MGRETRASLCCGIGASIIEKRFDIHLDTVAKSNKLQDRRDGGEGQERSPVVLQSFRVVDVTCISKSVGYFCKWKCDCKEQGRYSPSCN